MYAPGAAMPAISEARDMSTQTKMIQTSEAGTQFQLEQPPQPLIRAGQEPLVDRVVSPIIFTPMAGKEQVEYDWPSQPSQSSQAAQAAVSSPKKVKEEFPELEEEEDLPILLDYKPEDIRELEKQGRITREFLQGFQVKSIVKPQQRNMNLLKIAVALGIPTSRSDQSQTKKNIISYILRKLSEKK